MKVVITIFIIVFCVFISFNEITYSNGTVNDQMVEYELFLKTYGEVIENKYGLPEDGDFSYWGTNKATFFYKTPNSKGAYKEPYWTKGDLNYDNILDRCYILFSIINKNVDLFCFISKTEETYKLIKVAPAMKTMGVYINQKNSQGEKSKLVLYEFEGHSQYFSWSKDKQAIVEE